MPGSEDNTDHSRDKTPDEAAREEIIRNYETGGKDDENIEETEFDIHYIHYDRYGFVHDLRLQDNSRQSSAEKKWLEKEKTREEKWISMITDVKKWFCVGDRFYQKMSDRVWKGVPDKMRGTVWRILIDVESVKTKQQGIYNKMKILGRQSSQDISQIDLDVRRTFRRHVMFRERYSPGQTDLFHVLTAHSVYNRQVGYCQGMSNIAALLLIYINCDEDTFFALGHLLFNNKYNLKSFFTPTFPKLEVFQTCLDQILVMKLNKLHCHLKQQNSDPRIYSVRWFLQCYVDSLPFSLTLRVWDLFLLLGDTVLLAMAYNILKLHCKSLIKMDMDLIGEFFQKTLPTSFGFEDDFVIDSLRETVEELNSLQLNLTVLDSNHSSQRSQEHVQQTKDPPAQQASIPLVRVSHSSSREDLIEESDDETLDIVDAEMTVIVEEHDDSIISTRSLSSSRDDCSSFDFYEDMMLIETDHINTPASTQGINRHRLPLRDIVDKRDIQMFKVKLRLLFERKMDERDKSGGKSKVNFVKKVRIQNVETVDSTEMPKSLEADIIIERQM